MDARKARRILSGSGIPHAALERLLRRLAEAGLPEEVAFSRDQLQRGSEHTRLATEVVEELPLLGGGAFRWSCVSLKKALPLVVRSCGSLAQELARRWEEQPCAAGSEWHLSLYGDEVTPGNVLAPNNRRKMCCFYAAIRELGPSVLRHEAVWVPIGVLRTEMAKRIDGGLAAAVRAILRRWFVLDALSTEGCIVQLPLAGGLPARLLFKMGNFIADADGHREFWGWKGASGKLPCAACKNVVNGCDGPGLLPLSCTDPSRFAIATSADWWLKVDRLRDVASTRSRQVLSRFQTAMGMNHTPEGVLLDCDLRHFVRPSEVFTYDSMHVFLSNGVAQVEVDALLGKLREAGLSLTDLQRYVLGEWKFCQARSKISLANCFTAARLKAFVSEGRLRVGASEMLTLMPVLYMFLVTVVVRLGRLTPEIESFKALAFALHLVARGKTGERSIHADLAGAVRHHAECFQRAYPDVSVRPKHHYAHHIAMQLARDGVIYDAFTGERKHQSMKVVANNVANTTSFEQSVIFEALERQLVDLEAFELHRSCLRAAAPAPDMFNDFGAATEAAASMYWQGMLFGRGDLVCVRDYMLVVGGAVSVNQHLYIVGARCHKLREVARLAWEVRQEEEWQLYECDSSVRTLGPWRAVGDRILTYL